MKGWPQEVGKILAVAMVRRGRPPTPASWQSIHGATGVVDAGKDPDKDRRIACGTGRMPISPRAYRLNRPNSALPATPSTVLKPGW